MVLGMYFYVLVPMDYYKNMFRYVSPGSKNEVTEIQGEIYTIIHIIIKHFR